MSRSDKATLIQRVQDVLRLILSGAEFAAIRQFASANGWNVTDRQVRRYQEAAFRGVAKIARRDRVQLLGRHIMQRLALYARALKNNDLRTALLILRDEAELEGLYPSANGARAAAHKISDSPQVEVGVAIREVRQMLLSDPKLLEAIRIVETEADKQEAKPANE
jgi:hypothetical protein